MIANCDGDLYLPILHLPRVELHCKLQEKLHRVTAALIRFKNSIIHEQNTKQIIAVKESLYAIKHTFIFTKRLPRFSPLIQHLY